MLPFDEYQIANLFGLLIRVVQAKSPSEAAFWDNGDWFHETFRVLLDGIIYDVAARQQWYNFQEFEDVEFDYKFGNNFGDKLQLVKKKGDKYAHLFINGQEWSM